MTRTDIEQLLTAKGAPACVAADVAIDIMAKLQNTIQDLQSVKFHFACPYCFNLVHVSAEEGMHGDILTTTTCKVCKKSFSVTAERVTKVTKLVPRQEGPCTVTATQLRLAI